MLVTLGYSNVLYDIIPYVIINDFTVSILGHSTFSYFLLFEVISLRLF